MTIHGAVVTGTRPSVPEREAQREVSEVKVYCIYYAPDELMIREHARLCDIPADRISAVRRLLDPANFATS